MTISGINSIKKLFEGYGRSDAYGSETILLHESEIEKIARKNRSATRCNSEPRGWPSDDEARAAFEPLVNCDTLAAFRRDYAFLQHHRGREALGMPTEKTEWIEAAVLAILDACDDAE